MIKKGTKLYSILYFKCPRCQEADFFKHKHTFNPTKFAKVHDNCPNCGFKHMIEPSFFFGAMYVNYGLFVALFVSIFIIAKVFIGATILQSFMAIIAVSFILAPYVMKLSRIIWSNMFVSFNDKVK